MPFEWKHHVSADQAPSELAAKLAFLFRDCCVDEALSQISAEPDVRAVAAALSSAVNLIYREHRDHKAMILAALTGLSWCRGQAAILHGEAEAALFLQSRAYAIAFNAGANCWPCWDEASAAIDDENVAFGLVLAGLCLDVARNCELTPRQRGNASWLVGAFLLALDRIGDAQAFFLEAEQAVRPLGENAPEALLARGYWALAEKRGGSGSTIAPHLLSAALDRLRAHGGSEGKFFAEQIERAERVLGDRDTMKRGAGQAA